MKPCLTFETEKIRMSTLGRESSVPDLREVTDPQKDRDYVFDDPDEVYIGYGELNSTYSYRLYDCVETALTEKGCTGPVRLAYGSVPNRGKAQGI